MKKNNFYYVVLLLLFGLLSNNAFSQQYNTVFNFTSTPAAGVYIARDSIQLLPAKDGSTGFDFKATNDSTFDASIGSIGHSCINAITLLPSDTIIQLSISDSVAWFVYQANSPFLQLSLFSFDLMDAPPSITGKAGIHLYSGSCNNLTEIVNSNSLEPQIFSNNNISYPNTYYIKVNYLGEWQATLFIKNQNTLLQMPPCTHNCDLISNGDFSQATITPDGLGMEYSILLYW